MKHIKNNNNSNNGDNEPTEKIKLSHSFKKSELFLLYHTSENMVVLLFLFSWLAAIELVAFCSPAISDLLLLMRDKLLIANSISFAARLYVSLCLF